MVNKTDSLIEKNGNISENEKTELLNNLKTHINQLQDKEKGGNYAGSYLIYLFLILAVDFIFFIIIFKVYKASIMFFPIATFIFFLSIAILDLIFYKKYKFVYIGPYPFPVGKLGYGMDFDINNKSAFIKKYIFYSIIVLVTFIFFYLGKLIFI